MLVLKTGETGLGQNALATLGGAIIVTSKSELQRLLMHTSTCYYDPVAMLAPTADDSQVIVVVVIAVGVHEAPP